MHEMMGHFGMDDSPNHQQGSDQHGNYSNDVWGGIPANSYSSSQQTSPVYEYQSYQFMNHGLPHSLPEEPTFTRMSPPQTQQQTLLPLLPAPMANPAWMSNMPALSSLPPTMPSMLTNPGGLQVRPVRIAPNSTRVRASKPESVPPARRTLNDDKRKRMCQYHEDNPGLKQGEIGRELFYSCQTKDANVYVGVFGVERRYAS